jgi:hypothetical protein
MTELLIGTETTYASHCAKDYIYMQKYAALKSGTIKEILVYSESSGNVKAGMYSDNAGSPDVQLAVNNSGIAVTGSQWNIITISDLAIVKDTYYWLAILADTIGAVAQNNSGGTGTAKSQAYSSGLPSPAGSGYTPNSNLQGVVGYGDSIKGHPLFFGTGF